MKKLVIAGLAACGLLAACADDIGVTYADGDPVNGDITVAPNATLELPASATVNVTFTSKPIGGGSWTLVDVGTMVPANLEWTVNASVAGMSVVKSVSPARVAIEVLPAGTIILFR